MKTVDVCVPIYISVCVGQDQVLPILSGSFTRDTCTIVITNTEAKKTEQFQYLLSILDNICSV